jgi:hypothetical protein
MTTPRTENEDDLSELRLLGKFERRVQTVLQGLTLAFLIALGSMMYGLIRSAAQQEVTNGQTVKDIAELKSELSSLRIQTTTVATALAATTAAAAAAKESADQNKRSR